MKISVIIPAYNAQQHIARAIDSVLKQTRPADEIIVIDDGSVDKTADIVLSYCSKVQLIRQSNAGASVARNAGITAAAGDWIAFLDADDEWLPDKLKLQTEHLERHPELEWTFSNLSWRKSKKCGLQPAHSAHALPQNVVEREFFDDYFQAYVKGFFASTITLLIHKTVFQNAGLFERGMKRAQDNDLWYRIAYQYPQVGYLSQPLAIYHLDTPGSSTKINDSVDFMINLVRRHESLAKKYNRFDAFRPCMTHMLQTWIRQLLEQNRRCDVGILLEQFRDYLSPRFCREIRFQMAIPFAGSAIVKVVFWIKKKCLSGLR